MMPTACGTCAHFRRLSEYFGDWMPSERVKAVLTPGMAQMAAVGAGVCTLDDQMLTLADEDLSTREMYGCYQEGKDRTDD